MEAIDVGILGPRIVVVGRGDTAVDVGTFVVKERLWVRIVVTTFVTGFGMIVAETVGLVVSVNVILIVLVKAIDEGIFWVVSRLLDFPYHTPKPTEPASVMMRNEEMIRTLCARLPKKPLVMRLLACTSMSPLCEGFGSL